MKKLILAFVSVAIFFAVSASAQGLNAGFGLGGSYPKAPDKIGFDSKLFVDAGINKFFALGLESGFGWIRMGSGEKVGSGSATLTSVNNVNFYSIPLLLRATIFIPVGEYDSPLKPYISGGAGYSWTIWSEADNVDLPKKNTAFYGFTWQAALGLDYNLGSEASNMSLFIEVGYRGTMLERKIDKTTYELDMSGVFVKAGFAFPLVASNY